MDDAALWNPTGQGSSLGAFNTSSLAHMVSQASNTPHTSGYNALPTPGTATATTAIAGPHAASASVLPQAVGVHAGDMAVAAVHVAGHAFLPPVSEEQGLVSSSSTGMTAHRSVGFSDPCHVAEARASAPASNAALSGAGSDGGSVHGSLPGMLAAGLALLGARDAAGVTGSNPPSGAMVPVTASSSGKTVVSTDGEHIGVGRSRQLLPQQQQYEQQQQHNVGSGI